MINRLSLFAGILFGLLLGVSTHAAVIKTITADATDQSVTLKIIDSADGTPETAVAYDTSGIDLKYWRHGANSVVDITEATQTINGAHSDGGFVAVGFGQYRLDLPDAAVASGATAVDIIGTVTGMIVIGGTVQLSTDVAQTGDSYARLGAPAGASVSADVAAIEAQTDDIGVAGAGLTAIDLPNQTMDIAGSITGNLSGSVGSVTGDIGGIAANGLTLDAFNVDTNPLFGILRRGTAQSATGTTLVMDTGAAFGDSTLVGATIWGCGSTQGYCQANSASANVGSTDTVTVGTWAVTPSGTIDFYAYGTAAGTGGGDATEAKQDTILANLATVDTVADAIKVKTDYLPSATAGASGGLFIAGSNAGTTVNFTGNLSGSVGSVTGAVGSVTGNVGGNVTGSVGSLATQAKADVEAEANDALVAIHLDHLLAADYDPASKPGVSTALLNELVESDAGVSRYTANALEQAPSGTGASAEAIADEVQTRTIAAVTLVNGLAANTITAAATAADFTTEVTAGLQADTDDIQTRLPAALVGGRMDTSVGAMAANVMTATAAASDFGTEVAAAVTTAQGILTGTCDSGSTTTCVDDALTQADATQLEDRLICFDDSWCALITTFTPGTDTATTTKTAPSTRASKAYTIFPATVE